MRLANGRSSDEKNASTRAVSLRSEAVMFARVAGRVLAVVTVRQLKQAI
jgi:hypothetical protein